MSCDICGKKGTPLNLLSDSYKTEDIQPVCSDCLDIINHKKASLLSMVLNILASLLKRFMAERKAAKEPS